MTSRRSFAFFSRPPPFSCDAMEHGEGPHYSIALHLLSQEEKNYLVAQKSCGQASAGTPPGSEGSLFFFFLLFFFPLLSFSCHRQGS